MVTAPGPAVSAEANSGATLLVRADADQSRGAMMTPVADVDPHRSNRGAGANRVWISDDVRAAGQEDHLPSVINASQIVAFPTDQDADGTDEMMTVVAQGASRDRLDQQGSGSALLVGSRVAEGSGAIDRGGGGGSEDAGSTVADIRDCNQAADAAGASADVGSSTTPRPETAPDGLELQGDGPDLPHSGAPDAESDYHYSRRIACLSAPDGAVAESFRALQTHLLARHVRDGRRGLAICSPSDGAGCTTVAVNLAMACAQAGIRTLLIDANLQRPGVQDFVRPHAPAQGLVDMLLAGDRAGDEIHREVRPNLSILFAGATRSRSRDLVSGRRFKQVIDDCMRSFEFTIVDTPALRAGTEARQIAMAVRYAMLVARRDLSLVGDVRGAIEELSRDRIQLIGSFLTEL